MRARKCRAGSSTPNHVWRCLVQGGDLGTFRTYILRSKRQRFSCNNQKGRNKEHHDWRTAELGFYLIPTQKMTKIMSSLYMREMALYDQAFNCLWRVLKSILVSGLHWFIYFYIPTPAFCSAPSSVTGIGLGLNKSKSITQYRAGWSCPAGQYDARRYTYCSLNNSILTGATDCMRKNYLHFWHWNVLLLLRELVQC